MEVNTETMDKMPVVAQSLMEHLYPPPLPSDEDMSHASVRAEGREAQGQTVPPGHGQPATGLVPYMRPAQDHAPAEMVGSSNKLFLFFVLA